MDTFNLVVIRPFGDFKIGDRIEDTDTILEILLSSNVHHVVPVASVAEASQVN